MTNDAPFKYFRTSPEISRLAVMIYVRFPLSLRNVEDLLVLDDWGPEQLTAPQRRDLMEMIDERCSRKATIITSQLPIDTWHDMIGDPTFADVILDRLVHNAHKFALDGLSMRKGRIQTKQKPEAEAGDAP